MARKSANNLKNGNTFLYEGEPFIVLDNVHSKSGKHGSAKNRIKCESLFTQKKKSLSFTADTSVEIPEIQKKKGQIVTIDESTKLVQVMDLETYEQVTASKELLGDTAQWLIEEDLCLVTLMDGFPIVVTPPNFVVMEIVETDPGVRGDTSGGGNKPATLTSGAVVRVPLFVQQGEKVKVDTRTGDYVSRA